MRKHIIAILAALLITACVGIPIFAVGGAVLLNRNTATMIDTSSQVTAISDSDLPQMDQVAQLNGLISQYQDHEQQYQQREQQLRERLLQANAQIQQDQQLIQQVQILLGALQQRGMISITGDGRIIIN